jgi:hypothetical protein
MAALQSALKVETSDSPDCRFLHRLHCVLLVSEAAAAIRCRVVSGLGYTRGALGSSCGGVGYRGAQRPAKDGTSYQGQIT